MNSVETKGRTIDEAVAIALRELHATREMVEIEVIEEANKGIFGLIGGKEAKVRVSLINNVADKAQRFLEDVLSKMGVKADVKVNYEEQNKKLFVELNGDEAGILIGRRGETLDALQYLTNLVVNKGMDEFVRVTLDTENYRSKREEALRNLASKLAARVTKYKRSVTLEPMNPYERRIIHEALQGNTLVSTYSTGDEPNRRIVIAFRNNRNNIRSKEQE